MLPTSHVAVERPDAVVSAQLHASAAAQPAVAFAAQMDAVKQRLGPGMCLLVQALPGVAHPSGAREESTAVAGQFVDGAAVPELTGPRYSARAGSGLSDSERAGSAQVRRCAPVPGLDWDAFLYRRAVVQTSDCVPVKMPALVRFDQRQEVD